MMYYTNKAKTMTTAQLKDALFVVNMVDRWTSDDWNKYNAYSMELASRKNK